MKHFRKPILVLQLVLLSSVGWAQSIRFRNVLGNTGYDYGMSAQQTFDKGYIVCGSTTSVGNGNTDIYIIKTDSLGRPVNERSIGGVSVDRGTCIRQTADSGYIVLGYTNEALNTGYDIVAIKTDINLNVQWKKTYGGTDWDFGKSIRQTTDGGYIICGGTYSYGKGDEDYYLIKTNSKGDTLWTRTYGSMERDEANSVVQTSDGGYILTGYTMATDTLGNFYTVKVNSNGDTVWTNTYGGPKIELAHDIIEFHAGGGYIVAGETSSTGAGKTDGILMEITTAGKSGRTFMIGGANDDNLQALAERPDGCVMYVGQTFNYGFANGKGDLYFGIMNPDWSSKMTTTFGSDGRETVNSVAVTEDKGAILCGSTNGFRNFLDDIYLVKTDSTGFSTKTETVLVTRLNEQSKDAFKFIIFPNPVQHIVYIEAETGDRTAVIGLSDITGRLLRQETISFLPHSPVSLNVEDLAEGIYFINLTTSSGSFSKKMVVKHE